MLGDITSSNATLVLTVDTLFPAGIQIQQFTADTGMSADGMPIAEARMGIDGHMAAGQVPSIKQVTIQVEACSVSNGPLSAIHKAMDEYHKIYKCSLVCKIPSTGVTMTWSEGVMVSGTPATSLQRTLSPSQWTFQFAKFEKTGGVK